MVQIAIDAMGGDNGLETTIPGVIKALKINPEIRVILFGNKKEIEKILVENGLHHQIMPTIKIVNINDEDNIPMDIKNPLTASITHKGSSMIKAIESVKSGESEAIVSSGNTGALVSSSLRILKRLVKKGSFALAGDFPDINSQENTLAIDLGADINPTSTKIIKNTIMAAIFLKETRKIKKPKVGFISTKEEKDIDLETYKKLKELDLIEFVGYINPEQILDNDCDLIVTDGFKGNILLKTAEGAAKSIMQKAKKDIKTKTLSILLGLSVKKTLQSGIENLLNKEMEDKENVISVIPNINVKDDNTILLGIGNAEEGEIKNIIGKLKILIGFLKENKNKKTINIGIVNIGTEKGKGRDFEQKLFEEIEKLNLGDSVNFIEPDNLLNNNCDIAITDKETGDIIKKTISGVIRDIIEKIDMEIKKGGFLGNIIGNNKLKTRLQEFANQAKNGASLLGANGVVVKAHGGACPDAFANAILIAYKNIKSGVLEKTKIELEKLKQETKI